MGFHSRLLKGKFRGVWIFRRATPGPALLIAVHLHAVGQKRVEWRVEVPLLEGAGLTQVLYLDHAMIRIEVMPTLTHVILTFRTSR